MEREKKDNHNIVVPSMLESMLNSTSQHTPQPTNMAATDYRSHRNTPLSRSQSPDSGCYQALVYYVRYPGFDIVCFLFFCFLDLALELLLIAH